MDCARCQIWPQLQKTDGKVILHRDATELADGARSGCWWCIRILLHLQRKLKSLPESLQGYPSDVTYGTGSESLFEFRSFALLCVSFGDNWGSTVFFKTGGEYNVPDSFAFTTLLDSPLKLNTRTDPLADNTNSQQTWQYITNRLENCKKNHQLCKQSLPDLPSRLVEIREEDGKLCFRLAISPRSGAQGRYVTLSHMWGENTTLKLTAGNLSDFTTEIPRQKMPQKYIDAAIVTLRLKIRYLWIDSLCIIQDSHEDWERESGKMNLVYQGGYCNLAATSAADCSEGLFYKRSPAQVGPHNFRLPTSGKLMPIFVYEDKLVLHDLDGELLNRRGWVLQERLLSTRNISFSRRLVYFECAEDLSCEMVDSVKIIDGTYEFKSSILAGFRCRYEGENSRIPISLKSITSDDALSFWHRIIVIYSEAKITVPSDKLVAISGIASVFQPVLGSEYLAGLWKSTLARDLCWFSSKRVEHVRNYHAPSWSWASVDGGVGYSLSITTQQVVKIMDTYTMPVTETNPHGAVQNSWIQLVGWIFPMFHQGCDVGEFQHARIDEQAKNSSSDPVDLYYSLDGLEGIIFMDESRFNSGGSLETGKCFFLPMTFHKRRSAYMDISLSCLILAAVTPSRGVYQRIGLVRFDFELPRIRNWAGVGCLPQKENPSLEEVTNCVLPYMQHKFRHCKVPSYEGHTLERHQITLV